MTTDVTGFIACDCAADRAPLPGGPVHETDRWGWHVLCSDSSDGYSYWQRDALMWVKKHYPEIPVGGGNVVDGEAFTFLAEAGPTRTTGSEGAPHQDIPA